MAISVDNSSPATLLRAFPDRTHAEDLVRHGRVRLGSILSYRTIEDEKRRDPTEGEVRLQVPGPVTTLHIDPVTLRVNNETVAPGLLNFGSSYHNPVYALCMSSPDVQPDHFRHLGRYVIRISDTSMLLDDVVEALRTPPVAECEVLFVDLCPVVYNKGTIAPAPRGDSIKLHYSQKPDHFSSDCEHRLAVGLSGPLARAPSHIFLQLARAGAYCELLDYG